MPSPVTFTEARLPSDYCFHDLQSYADDIINRLTGSVSVNGVVIGPNLPAVTDQDKLWIKTDNAGNPIGQFIFNGRWIWPHETPASGQERRIWVGQESDLWAYDGGDGTDPTAIPPTAVSGAMW